MKLISTLLALGIASVLSAAEMPNLIKNGSFEEGLDKNGAPKHWIIDRSDKVDGVVKLVPEHATHGKTAVFLDKRNTRGSLYLRQKLHLKPNTDYILEVKGYRESGHRWHSVAMRQPDTRNIAHSKIPVDGGAITPIKFHTDVKKTLCYVYFGLWGYTKENNKGTIGKMWVDEVVLRELPRITGKFKGIGHYYYAADGVRASLFSTDYAGQVTVKITAANGKNFSKNITVKPGENMFTFNWKDLPVGLASLSAKGGNIDIAQKVMIQSVRE